MAVVDDHALVLVLVLALGQDPSLVLAAYESHAHMLRTSKERSAGMVVKC